MYFVLVSSIDCGHLVHGNVKCVISATKTVNNSTSTSNNMSIYLMKTEFEKYA